MIRTRCVECFEGTAGDGAASVNDAYRTAKKTEEKNLLKATIVQRLGEKGVRMSVVVWRRGRKKDKEGGRKTTESWKDKGHTRVLFVLL